MHRKIEIEGELLCQSERGSLRIIASGAEVQLQFSSVQALRAAVSYDTMKTFLKYRKSSGFLSQDVVLKVDGSEWLALRSGAMHVKNPLSLAALYVGLWRSR